MFEHLPRPPLPPAAGALADRAVSMLPPLGLRLLSALPPPLSRPAFEAVLNRALARPLAAGDFAFLTGRTVCIELADADWAMTIAGGEDGRLRVVATDTADTRIRATALDFLALAAGHVDPDTLFFQRRLRIEGDVALGLEVKNTLDGVDRQALAPPLRLALHAARLCFASAESRRHRRDALSSPGRPNQ